MLDVPRFFSYGILLEINLFFTDPRISVFVMILCFFLKKNITGTLIMHFISTQNYPTVE